MEAHEWYDNYYCKKCKRDVHENHNTPQHECIIYPEIRERTKKKTTRSIFDWLK